eukprot:gene33625-43457_t
MRFEIRCDIALRTNDSGLLRSIYAKAKALPTTATLDELYSVHSYFVVSQFFNGNDNVHICFKEGLPHVMKTSTSQECSRVTLFLDTLAESGSPVHEHIISMELMAHGHNHFIFMPLHPTTLEHLPYLQGEDFVRHLWYQAANWPLLAWNCARPPSPSVTHWFEEKSTRGIIIKQNSTAFCSTACAAQWNEPTNAMRYVELRMKATTADWKLLHRGCFTSPTLSEAGGDMAAVAIVLGPRRMVLPAATASLGMDAA